MLDIIGIRWLIVSNSTSDYFSLNEWLIAEGYPEFLYQILCAPLWIGLICAAIFKIGKNFIIIQKVNFARYVGLLLLWWHRVLRG